MPRRVGGFAADAVIVSGKIIRHEIGAANPKVHLPSTFSTASVIAFADVLIDGSGTGA